MKGYCGDKPSLASPTTVTIPSSNEGRRLNSNSPPLEYVRVERTAEPLIGLEHAFYPST